MSTDVIKPFSGPPPSPQNFAEAYPDLEPKTTPVMNSQAQRALRPLDPISQRALEELRRQMRSNPPKPATVINLHPWSLSFNNEMYLRGIKIPECPPGQEFAHHHIRAWSVEKAYNEDTTFRFSAILPVHKAAQFLRVFADPQVYGGGVLIYEGDANPAKVRQVELYNQDGRPMTTQQGGFDEDDEGHRLPVTQEISVRGDFQQMMVDARARRNEFYLSKVQWADERYKSNDAKDRRLITSLHRMMAEVLYAEHIIPTIPDWNTKTSLQDAMEDSLCKSCGTQVKPNAPKCAACGYIVDLVAAFRFGLEIPEGRMAAGSEKELEAIEEIRDGRKPKVKAK